MKKHEGQELKKLSKFGLRNTVLIVFRMKKCESEVYGRLLRYSCRVCPYENPTIWRNLNNFDCDLKFKSSENDECFLNGCVWTVSNF